MSCGCKMVGPPCLVCYARRPSRESAPRSPRSPWAGGVGCWASRRRSVANDRPTPLWSDVNRPRASRRMNRLLDPVSMRCRLPSMTYASCACGHRSRPPDTRRAHVCRAGIASGSRSHHPYHSFVHAARALLATIALMTIFGACGFMTGTIGQDGPPVPAGPLGPVFPGEGGAPAVECRGVPVERCRGFVSLDQQDVVRVIVTCTAACTPEQGEVRIDVLLPDGSTRSAGQGSYASAPARAAPVPDPSNS